MAGALARLPPAWFAGGSACARRQQLPTGRRFCWYDIHADGPGVATAGALPYNVLLFHAPTFSFRKDTDECNSLFPR